MSTEPLYQHKTFRTDNANGQSLFYQYWLPKGEHIANLIIAHGIGEHSSRYRHVVEFLIQKGYAIIAGDHQGHGLSEGKRGHVAHFNEFARDLELIRQTTLEVQQNKPTFLLGHSLGGLIAIDHLLSYDQSAYAGVVFSSPAFGIRVPVPTWKYTLAKLLYWIMPSFTMANGIDPDDLSHDRDEVEMYRKDELVHDQVSVAMFLSMLEIIQYAHDQADHIKLPVLLMISENDKVISKTKALELFSLLGTEDKKLYICPISNHEIFNEIDRTQNIEKMWAWTDEKLK